MASPDKVLYELLLSLFTPEQLERFLDFEVGGRNLADALPRHQAAADFTFTATLELRRQGYIRPRLFTSLIEAAPERRQDITAAAQAFGFSLAHESSTPATERPASLRQYRGEQSGTPAASPATSLPSPLFMEDISDGDIVAMEDSDAPPSATIRTNLALLLHEIIRTIEVNDPHNHLPLILQRFPRLLWLIHRRERKLETYALNLDVNGFRVDFGCTRVVGSSSAYSLFIQLGSPSASKVEFVEAIGRLNKMVSWIDRHPREAAWQKLTYDEIRGSRNEYLLVIGRRENSDRYPRLKELRSTASWDRMRDAAEAVLWSINHGKPTWIEDRAESMYSCLESYDIGQLAVASEEALRALDTNDATGFSRHIQPVARIPVDAEGRKLESSPAAVALERWAARSRGYAKGMATFADMAELAFGRVETAEHAMLCSGLRRLAQARPGDKFPIVQGLKEFLFSVTPRDGSDRAVRRYAFLLGVETRRTLW